MQLSSAIASIELQPRAPRAEYSLPRSRLSRVHLRRQTTSQNPTKKVVQRCEVSLNEFIVSLAVWNVAPLYWNHRSSIPIFSIRR